MKRIEYSEDIKEFLKNIPKTYEEKLKSILKIYINMYKSNERMANMNDVLDLLFLIIKDPIKMKNIINFNLEGGDTVHPNSKRNKLNALISVLNSNIIKEKINDDELKELLEHYNELKNENSIDGDTESEVTEDNIKERNKIIEENEEVKVNEELRKMEKENEGLMGMLKEKFEEIKINEEFRKLEKENKRLIEEKLEEVKKVKELTEEKLEEVKKVKELTEEKLKKEIESNIRKEKGFEEMKNALHMINIMAKHISKEDTGLKSNMNIIYEISSIIHK